MSCRREWSLRRRLLLWLLIPLLILGALLLFDAFRAARNAADQAYDKLIAASALAIADRVVATDGGLDIDLPYVALEMLATPADDRVFYRISDSDGAFVTGYQDLPQPSIDQPDEAEDPVFYDSNYRGEEIRVVLLTQPITGPGIGGRFGVQIAQTRGERDLLAHQLAAATGIRLFVMILVVGLITWFGIRFGLSPLERLRAAVRRRSPQDLRPLEVEVPGEVRDLVGAIDTLMRRLAGTLASMERFIADAAHQLRTPLAALQAQVATALREKDSSALRSEIEKLQAITWRTSRLATQLLSDARSTADPASSPRSRVHLASLAADVTRAHVPTALLKNIDLGFEGADCPDQISGDDVLLRETVTNLVDNALQYCPENSQVTVRIGPGVHKGELVLEVEDNGPGIAAAQRGLVLERFYRVPGTGKEGSGLGLSIARSAVERHGGSIGLHDGSEGGLLVRLIFPTLKDSRSGS